MTRPVVDVADGRRRAPVRAHRRGGPEGLLRADRAVHRLRPDGRRGSRVTRRARSARRCAPAACSRDGAARSWRCSPAGATRSACSTSPSRCCGAGAVQRAARQLRPARGRPTTTSATARSCASSSACELEVVRARRAAQRRGRATCRPGRASCATSAAAAASRAQRDALIATGHTASDQVETILYRLAASPGRRALLGMPAAEGRLVRPLLGADARADGRLLPRARACAGARTRATRTSASRARACATARAGAARGASGGGGQRAAHGAAAARGDRAARRARRRRARRAATRSRSRGWPSCRRRSRGWSWCAWPSTPPAPTCRRPASACGSCSRWARAADAPSCTSAGSAGAVIEDGVLRMVRLPPREPRDGRSRAAREAPPGGD